MNDAIASAPSPASFLTVGHALKISLALAENEDDVRVARARQRCYRKNMTQIADRLDKKLATWCPHVAAQVEQIVAEVIELADSQALDLLPSRAVVQEVLNTLDESQAG
jgi:hypothetical protein